MLILAEDVLFSDASGLAADYLKDGLFDKEGTAFSLPIPDYSFYILPSLFSGRGYVRLAAGA